MKRSTSVAAAMGEGGEGGEGKFAVHNLIQDTIEGFLGATQTAWGDGFLAVNLFSPGAPTFQMYLPVLAYKKKETKTGRTVAKGFQAWCVGDEEWERVRQELGGEDVAFECPLEHILERGDAVREITAVGLAARPFIRDGSSAAFNDLNAFAEWVAAKAVNEIHDRVMDRPSERCYNAQLSLYNRRRVRVAEEGHEAGLSLVERVGLNGDSEEKFRKHLKENATRFGRMLQHYEWVDV